ncbi:MAG: glutamine--tRNA ligase/YqeY domain fusion protein [Verrucomicrobia bacterium]|nr:glutamine--tRNA ligase/YqeY domain fusion protein [Verrucomicrobiota bacterium]
MSSDTPLSAPTPRHFIQQIVDADLAAGKHAVVATRFPPEPNGYLHVGHAKSICLNFGLALEFKGRCHLRMDDTNPTKEDIEYVDSIKEDVRWLGFDWHEHYYQASDYFDRMHADAIKLIKLGKAFVCHLTLEQMNAYRGDHKTPGKNSPTRDASIEENLALFEKMTRGEIDEGKAVLRAKIDMASPNFHLRDPIIYRIRKTSHHNTGDKWCVYPMYDYAHPLEDAYEGITHSICTLEFEVHRPFYDWLLRTLDTPAKPQQIEFARLNLTYTVMSKRRLLELVQEKRVTSWDDPRMPTISGMRRRGYTPAAIRKFCETIGVTKHNSLTDVALLEHAIREDLNKTSPRFMAVLDPVRLVIENYPSDQVEHLEAQNNPEDPAAGSRQVPFSKTLLIERADFMEIPEKKYFRLTPGQEVRLRWGYFVTCTGCKKDAAGNITEVTCTYDPATRGGDSADGRKVKGTIHWVSEAHAGDVEVRLYDRLFSHENLNDLPDDADWRNFLNPTSLKVIRGFVEPELLKLNPSTRVQFERTGYFCVDAKDSQAGKPVFNRTVGLRDSWAKQITK